MSQSSSIKTVSELAQVIDADKLYTRQEVAEVVGCIWANVLDASRGDNPKLKGAIVEKGKVKTWMFTGRQVLDWRQSVDARKGTSATRIIITLESPEELAELKAALADTKFAGRF